MTINHVFGITWIENVTTENDAQTRYGADQHYCDKKEG